MAASGLGFQEEKMSENGTCGVVSPVKLGRSLIQIGVRNVTTGSDREEMFGERNLSFDEGQASNQNNAGAASQRTISSHSTSSAHVENEQISVTQIENVGGYLVKAELAPILRLIFAKHGDIASNIKFKTCPEYATILLEIVSEVFKKLLEGDFSYVLSDLSNMLVLTEVLAMGDIRVSWLERHLAEIEEVKKLAIKAAAREFDEKKKTIMLAKKMFKEIQRRLV